MKDLHKDTIPSNYRLITCLSAKWKLLSATRLSKHISTIQRSIGKHQWQVDRAEHQASKTRQTNETWTDYKKENSVLHSWKLKCLALYSTRLLVH